MSFLILLKCQAKQKQENQQEKNKYNKIQCKLDRNTETAQLVNLVSR